MLQGRFHGVRTAASMRADVMYKVAYMVTYKAMYVAVYMSLHAVVRVHRLGCGKCGNATHRNDLTAVTARGSLRDRNLAFRGRNLANWARNLAFGAHNLAFLDRNLACLLKGHKDLRRFCEVTTRFLSLRMCAGAHTRRNKNRAHKSSGKITRITS